MSENSSVSFAERSSSLAMVSVFSLPFNYPSVARKNIVLSFLTSLLSPLRQAMVILGRLSSSESVGLSCSISTVSVAPVASLNRE